MLAILLATLTAASLFAQDPRGSIIGRITDVTGAVVPNVAVRAENVQTGVSATTTTNEAGRYNIPYIIAGTYRVSAELTGFKRFVRDNVQVRVGESTEVTIPMEVGQVSESIEVTSTTPLLETTSPSLGQVIDERRIMELPTLAGNAFELALLTPGVVNGTNLRDRKPAFNNGNSQVSTDGNGTYNNEFQIDGVSNTFADGGAKARVAFSPPQTAIQEFKMQTATYDASTGHTIGSTVNVSTKSGTNRLHGEGHWFVRNRAFDAPNFFDNKNNTTAPVYQDNRYGASAGGPVYIPKVYNGKNRTFWFYAWEANKWIVPGNYTGTVPTAAQRQGNFSDLLAINSSYQIFDPLTTTPAAGGRFSRQPFAGNIIPTSRLDKVGTSLVNLYPAANQPGTVDGRNNFYNSQLKSKEDYYVHLARVDHAFSENHRMFVRVHYDFWEEDKNDYFDNRINGIILNRINRGIALDDVLVLTPTLLANLRYGFTNQEFPERRVTQGYDLSSLGFSSNLTNLIDKSLAVIPRVSLGAYSQISPWESGDGTNSSFTHTFQANFTRLQSNHNLKFGADARVYRAFGNRYPTQIAPDFAFNTNYTRGPLDNAPSAQVGQELASMLLGVPAGSMALNASSAFQDQYLGLYIHDDFKITRTLTINLGLRYEKEWPLTERYNRINGGFDSTVASPIEAAAKANYARSPIPEIAPSAFQVKGGLLFANTGGLSRSPYNGESNNFMPRIGLAWQIQPQTIIRTGFGLFYDSIGVNKSSALQSGFSQSTPIQATLDSGLTYIANNANPFPTGLIPPDGASGGLSTFLGQGFEFYNRNRTHAYSSRWSFGIQRQIRDVVLDASYVGNRGTRLGIDQRINETPNQYLSTSPTRDQTTINYLSQTFPNPFRGTDPIYGANTSRAALLRPYPQFGTISVEQPMGYSWYHAFQVRAEKRFSHGYTFQLAYTWSKAMEAVEYLNVADTQPVEVISGLDRPHRIAVSGIYELPFGKGRAHANSLPKAADMVVGGWQFNAVIIYQSGQALGFGNAIFNGDINSIALDSGSRNADQWFNVDAGFNRVNNQQLASNYRTFPLRFSGIRGDGQNRWDFSMIKYFPINEYAKVQFRAEAFNVLNKTILNNPNTTPTNSSFGRITGTAAPARTFQFALKIEF
ncbi:MAG: carboxypeptidase-like regulatory domain-containing protein [Acidobacteriota bacterium]